MSPTPLAATVRRVLRQLLADRRSLALILLAPVLLMALFHYIYSGDPVREHLFVMISTAMTAFFPLILMFLVTSVTMQRERSGGTLERLWTTRIHRVDLIAGYAIAFALAAIAQSLLMVLTLRYLLGVETESPWWISTIIAAITGITGVALGLLSSAFARTEFQAVQTMPVLIIPQFLLCGLLVPRDEMPEALRWISEFLPLSYATDAALGAAANGATGEVARDILICLAFGIGFLLIAALSMPRRVR